jgi:hypothetical protein
MNMTYKQIQDAVQTALLSVGDLPSAVVRDVPRRAFVLT